MILAVLIFGSGISMPGYGQDSEAGSVWQQGRDIFNQHCALEGEFRTP